MIGQRAYLKNESTLSTEQIKFTLEKQAIRGNLTVSLGIFSIQNVCFKNLKWFEKSNQNFDNISLLSDLSVKELPTI